MNTKYVLIVLTIGLVCFSAISSTKASEEVLGVFGIKDHGDDTALALWISLDSTQSVAGIRWFNNDSNAAFSEVLAVAGVKGKPGPLGDAILVGADVSGVDSGWSEFIFTQPLASSTEGFYLYFRMPELRPFNHVGNDGGAGVGYCTGDGVLRSWLTGDGENWDPIGPEFMMAVEPIDSVAKSASANQDVLILGLVDGDTMVTVENSKPMLGQRGLQVFPNPFNPMTEIKFQLEASSVVELTVFDVRGRVVKHLLQEERAAGEHVVVWDGRSDEGRSLPSGVYLARVKSREGATVARMTPVQ